jgi:hypothetical protein
MLQKPSTGHASPSFAPSRRQFIFGSAIAAAAGVAGLARYGSPFGLANALAQTAPQPDADYAAFIKLSQYLTGKTSLDADIGHALYTVLVDNDASFAQQIARLNDFVARTSTPAGVLQQALDSTEPTLANVPKQVMSGWYLGVAGTGKKARAVAYEQALMYPPVADVVVMPSYARGVPGYWAEPPRFSPS